MATKKIKGKDFSMASSWTIVNKVVVKGSDSKDGNRKAGGMSFQQTTTPSLATSTQKFSYSLASGAKIKSAKITATVQKPPIGGIATLTVNGKALKKGSNNKYSAKVSLKSKSGTLSAAFKFRSSASLLGRTGVIKIGRAHV